MDPGCMNKWVKERKPEMWKAFWLLCKLLRVTTHRYPGTYCTQGEAGQLFTSEEI